MSYNIDVDMIQKNKLFQKFLSQEQQVQDRPRPPRVEEKNLEESSIYQDFANFAKASKHGSPYGNKLSCPQFQTIPSGNAPAELKDLQLRNKQLVQANQQLQNQLLDLQNSSHRLQVDLEISRGEVLSSKRVIQEQQIEIEQLKRQLQEKRSGSLEKTRQLTIVQTQLIQSNQMVEKLINQLMSQEQQMSLLRQTQFMLPTHKQPDMLQPQQPPGGYLPISITNPISLTTQQIPQPHQNQQLHSQQHSQPNSQQHSQQHSQQQPQQQQHLDTSYEKYLAHKRNNHFR